MNKKLLVLVSLLAVLIATPAHAEEFFDYVQNPPAVDLFDFRGRTGDTILDDDDPKTGYLFVRTTVKNRMCSQINETTNVNDENLRGGGCDSAVINVQVNVDKKDWSSIPFAQIGEFDNENNHITVIPYEFNVWQSTNRPGTYNDVMIERAVRAAEEANDFDDDELTKMSFWAPNVYFIREACLSGGIAQFSPEFCQPNIHAELGISTASDATRSAYNAPLAYTLYHKRKKPYCNDEVETALDDPTTYYSNPDRLDLSEILTTDLAGTLTSTSCKTIMFPEEGFINKKSSFEERMHRLTNILVNRPYVFHSLYYDDDIQYHSYPMVVDTIEMKCYKDGTVIESIKRDKRFGSKLNWFRFADRVRGERGGLIDTSGTEVIHCPSISDHYIVTIVLAKSYNYRHKSPVDATWVWSDVLDNDADTALTQNIESFDEKEFIVISQGGRLTPKGINSEPNKDGNLIGVSETATKVSGTDTPQDCYTCQNTGGGGINVTNSTGETDSGAGSGQGGSFISNAVDDSSASGLIQQSDEMRRVESKANFMESLIEIGKNILLFVITVYAFLSMIIIVLFFVVLFQIPMKMKETVIELFNKTRDLAK